uniref:Uncharacterized protein n=1 Tax=Romanomermis culicivorax TaxID=13658 RepID=A0A915ISB6_ROMCU
MHCIKCSNGTKSLKENANPTQRQMFLSFTAIIFYLDNNPLLPSAFQARAVNRPNFHQTYFTSENQLPYHRTFDPRPSIDATPQVPFQRHFGVCQSPYRLSAPNIYSQQQNPFALTQGPYALPQQSYYQASPSVTYSKQPTGNQTATVPPPPTTTRDSFEGRLSSEKFNNFLKRFNKTYSPSFDVEKAMRNFEQNERLVVKFGNERRSPYDAQVDITKFSDENFFDFRAAHTGAFLAENKTTIRRISGDSLQ